MSMDYHIEFSQIGSRGTVIAETSFGLEFTFDTLITPKVVRDRRGHRRVQGERRELVVRLLSPCCGAALEDHVCHTCGKRADWPEDLIEFEMASDAMLASNQWEPILTQYFPEYLEASLMAFSLHSSLMEVASAVKRGDRVRSVVRKLAHQA